MISIFCYILLLIFESILTMISLVGIGLISIGINIRTNVYKNDKIIIEKIKNEKVFTYPFETNNIMENDLLNKNNMSNNMIIKIPNDRLYKKFSIGKIKIQKIIKKKITDIKYDKDNNTVNIENKEIITKEPFLEHLLFPTCKFKEFDFDNKRFHDNKIKILFNNTIISKSHGNIGLIDKYINTLENNYVSNFLQREHFLNLITSGCDFELEENLIGNFNDLYLMVEPHLMSTNQESNQESNQEPNQEPKVKFNIIALSDNKDKIIKEKYISEINELNNRIILFYFSILSGVVVFLFK